jgi:hypothetical protein
MELQINDRWQAAWRKWMLFKKKLKIEGKTVFAFCMEEMDAF